MAEITFCERINVMLPDGLREQVNRAAVTEGMKQSEWIRAAIRERLQSMFSGPSDPPQGAPA